MIWSTLCTVVLVIYVAVTVLSLVFLMMVNR